MNIIGKSLFAAAALVASATPVFAAEVKPFDRAAFAAAQAANRPILVDVKAGWCPVCASQARTIKATIPAAAYDKLVIFELSYDNQKPEWQAFGVRKQATLIAFRGKTQIGRLEFVTDKAQIQNLLAQAVR
ncbi:MAG: thioredoxin family protein [Sphingomonadaceae bacterium]